LIIIISFIFLQLTVGMERNPFNGPADDFTRPWEMLAKEKARFSLKDGYRYSDIPSPPPSEFKGLPT
jgi:hypothetical protein